MWCKYNSHVLLQRSQPCAPVDCSECSSARDFQNHPGSRRTARLTHENVIQKGSNQMVRTDVLAREELLLPSDEWFWGPDPERLIHRVRWVMFLHHNGYTLLCVCVSLKCEMGLASGGERHVRTYRTPPTPGRVRTTSTSQLFTINMNYASQNKKTFSWNTQRCTKHNVSTQNSTSCKTHRDLFLKNNPQKMTFHKTRQHSRMPVMCVSSCPALVGLTASESQLLAR